MDKKEKSINIVCNNCGNTITVKGKGIINDDLGMEIFCTIYETVKIICNCGNKVEITD